MAPKRKNAELKLKSVWDEALIAPLLKLPKHRNRLWQYLVAHCKPDHCDNSQDKRNVTSFADVPFQEWGARLPMEATKTICSEFSLFTTTVVEKKESIRGDTTKLIVRLQDGHEVETVVIRHMGHATVCVSSQIGCQMGCKFCATGTMGIIGDLTAGEIVEQLIHANAVTRIRNVVFMGMGEPLNNFENVKMAVEFMVDSQRFGLASRHVTVSTVGVLKNMYRLSDELPNVNLALSLHAPNQEVRKLIVPAAGAHHLDKLMSAVDYHIKRTSMQPIAKEAVDNAPGLNQGALMFSENDDLEESANNVDKPGGIRRGRICGVMIEYILIRDVNDKDEHAEELARLLLPRRDHVLLNLIPYNPTEVAEDYLPPLPEQVHRFYSICSGKPYGIYSRVRQEKGQDIAGACGQLALVRGNNSGGDKDAAVVDLEDTGLAVKAPIKALSRTTSSAKSSVAPAPAHVPTQGSSRLLDAVLRSYEEQSLGPICDSSIWRERSLRIRAAMLANLLVPVTLLTVDWLSK